MKVKELIEALQHCHPESDVLFCVDFDSDEGNLIAVENEVQWKLDRGETEPVGTVYLHNTKRDFVHDTPLLGGNLFIT